VTASLIKLPRPLQPVPHYLVTFFALIQECLSGKRFGLPNIHIVGNLTSFALNDLSADQVGQIARSEGVMENLKLIPTHWSDVVVENYFVEGSFQDDKYNTKTNLDDGSCEHIILSENGQSNPILEISN